MSTLIQEAALYSTPTPKEGKKIDNIPFHIRELVTEKRRARSRWQRSRNNDDRLVSNRVRRKLHNALTNAKNKTLERYIASLSKDDLTLWKATEKFKRPQVSIPPIRKWDYAENMGETRRLKTLWAFTACYRDSFTFTSHFHGFHAA
jgi:hypothetical protein